MIDEAVAEENRFKMLCYGVSIYQQLCLLIKDAAALFSLGVVGSVRICTGWLSGVAHLLELCVCVCHLLHT